MCKKEKEKSKMKNRSIIGILCIILTIAVTFGVSPLVNKMTEGKMEVIQLTRTIRQGEEITSEDIKTVKIGNFGVDPKVIKTSEAIIGKYAVSNLFPDTNLTSEMFTTKANSPEDIFMSLDGNTKAISITIPNLASGLSGKLRQGDIVSVIVVTEEGGIIPPELNFLKVITTTSSTGTDTNPESIKQGEPQSLPATATLLVNDIQAKLIAYYDQTSKLHLSLVFRGETEQSDKFLKAQQEIFDRKSEETEGYNG